MQEKSRSLELETLFLIPLLRQALLVLPGIQQIIA